MGDCKLCRGTYVEEHPEIQGDVNFLISIILVNSPSYIQQFELCRSTYVKGIPKQKASLCWSFFKDQGPYLSKSKHAYIVSLCLKTKILVGVMP